MSLAPQKQVKGAGPASMEVQAVSAPKGDDNGRHGSGDRTKPHASVIHTDITVQRVNIVERYGRIPLAFETNQYAFTHGKHREEAY